MQHIARHALGEVDPRLGMLFFSKLKMLEMYHQMLRGPSSPLDLTHGFTTYLIVARVVAMNATHVFNRPRVVELEIMGEVGTTIITSIIIT